MCPVQLLLRAAVLIESYGNAEEELGAVGNRWVSALDVVIAELKLKLNYVVAP
jgi:hypothetical protein